MEENILENEVVEIEEVSEEETENSLVPVEEEEEVTDVSTEEESKGIPPALLKLIIFGAGIGAYKLGKAGVKKLKEKLKEKREAKESELGKAKEYQDLIDILSKNNIDPKDVLESFNLAEEKEETN